MVASHHSDVMFKAVLRDKAQQLPQVWHFGHGNAAVHGKGIIGEIPLAQIACQLSHAVIG